MFFDFYNGCFIIRLSQLWNVHLIEYFLKKRETRNPSSFTTSSIIVCCFQITKPKKDTYASLVDLIKSTSGEVRFWSNFLKNSMLRWGTRILQRLLYKRPVRDFCKYSRIILSIFLLVILKSRYFRHSWVSKTSPKFFVTLPLVWVDFGYTKMSKLLIK